METIPPIYYTPPFTTPPIYYPLAHSQNLFLQHLYSGIQAPVGSDMTTLCQRTLNMYVLHVC